MNMIVRHGLSVIVGVALTLVALELLLRALPLTDVHSADPRPDWPIRTWVPQVRYTHSTGWALHNVRHGSINDYGYVSPFDYQGVTHGVAVFGDSFVESLMNDYSEALAGALSRILGPRLPVMNFGMSNSAMAHYLGSAALIASRFHPDAAVVVVGVNDFTSSFKSEPGRFHWARGAKFPVELAPERGSSATRRLLRSLALTRYVRGSLRMTPRTLFREQSTNEAATPPCHDEVLSAEDRALIQAFVERFASALGVAPERVVLVFDSDRQSIYQRKPMQSACVTRDSLANQLAAALARRAGYHVVDTKPIFDEYYARTRHQVDYLPEDGHWNAEGHKLVAQRVASILRTQLDLSDSAAYAAVGH
jgi:lysophospholipase L1-like esterase